MNIHKILLFVILGIALFFGEKERKKGIIIATVILACFTGFRAWRMGDLMHYCYVFLQCNIPNSGVSITITDTWGLQLLYRIVGSLGGGFEACLFLISTFIAIALGVLISRYSPSPFWSYLMYVGMGFYLTTYTLLKQAIAMAIVMFAIMAMFERKPIRFLLLVGIAALFHGPALIVLAAYPVANKKIDAWYFIILTGVIVAVFMYRDQIVTNMSQLYYVDDMDFTAEKRLGGRVILMAATLMMAIYLRPLQRADERYNQVFNIMVLAMILQSFSVYDNVFTRLADYLYQFVILFIPMIMQPEEERKKMIPELEIRKLPRSTYQIAGIGLTLFTVWFYFNTIDSSWAIINNYHFFWQVDLTSSLELLEQELLIY